MAKSPRRPTEAPKTPSMPKFYNFYLSNSDKEQIKKEQLSESGAFKFIGSLCDRDYRVGISFDNVHSCYIVSATGRGDACPNAGYSTTARHADILIALTALQHQIDVIADGGRWDVGTTDANPFDW